MILSEPSWVTGDISPERLLSFTDRWVLKTGTFFNILASSSKTNPRVNLTVLKESDRPPTGYQ